MSSTPSVVPPSTTGDPRVDGVLVTIVLIQDTATRLVEEASRRYVVVEPGTAPLIQMRPMTLDEIVEDICECWAVDQRRQRES